MQRYPLFFAALFLLASAGCGKSPYDLAPVSGVVTLYGEPLRDATVSFEPLGGPDRLEVGPGSMGITDDNGKYELQTFKKETGAVVATHTVRISTFKSKFKDLKKSDDVEIVSVEHVPWQYNRNSSLTFDVPSGGTEEADFTLSTEGSR